LTYFEIALTPLEITLTCFEIALTPLEITLTCFEIALTPLEMMMFVIEILNFGAMNLLPLFLPFRLRRLLAGGIVFL
jgi:hypothetical protein